MVHPFHPSFENKHDSEHMQPDNSVNFRAPSTSRQYSQSVQLTPTVQEGNEPLLNYPHFMKEFYERIL